MELCRQFVRDVAEISRFAGLARWPARLVLVLLALLIAYGVATTLAPAPPAHAAASPMQRDAELYRAVAAHLARGDCYYPSAAYEQRLRGYPLKPFVTVRLPLLAKTTALVGGPQVMGWALQLLVLATALAMVWRLRLDVADRAARLAAIGLATLSLLVIAQPDLALWHEAWAAVLITLALAVHRPGQWGAAMVIALTAALLRELALPFLAVMAFTAAIERRSGFWRGEGAAWLGMIAIAVFAIGLHAYRVSLVVTAADAVSPGWSGVGGWPFVITMMAQASVFALLPLPLVALAVPLALLGWAGWANPMALRASLWLGGMVTVFMLFGRPDNFYWGMMLAPLLPVGLAFAPRALIDLARAAR